MVHFSCPKCNILFWNWSACLSHIRYVHHIHSTPHVVQSPMWEEHHYEDKED